MRELELCKSAYHKRDEINCWTLYIKASHRSQNRKATYDELRNALNKWNNTEINKPQCPIHFIPYDDPIKEKYFLEACSTQTESINNKQIISLMGQDWYDNYDKSRKCLWYKIVFYDSVEKVYYLRNFTSEKRRGHDNKVLIPSKKEGLYVDLSTMNAPAEFWVKLKDILFSDSVETNTKKNSFIVDKKVVEVKEKENHFWKDLKHINDRKSFIEILKKELIDEEIYYLCEKI